MAEPFNMLRDLARALQDLVTLDSMIPGATFADGELDLGNAALKNFHNARGNWTTIQDTGTAGAGSDDAATDGATVAYPLPSMTVGQRVLLGVQVDLEDSDGSDPFADGVELLVRLDSTGPSVYTIHVVNSDPANGITGAAGSFTVTGDDSGATIGVALSSGALTFSIVRTATARKAQITLWHHDPKDGPS